MAGDAVGAGIEGAANVTVGKGNMQQTVTVPEERDRHGDNSDLWRAVQRMESKLDLALSEQGRLIQQDASMASQLAMLAQQVAHITTQLVQVASQLAGLAAGNAERDRRVDGLAQAMQRPPATTSFDRVLVLVLAAVMLGLFAFNLWGGNTFAKRWKKTSGCVR